MFSKLKELIFGDKYERKAKGVLKKILASGSFKVYRYKGGTWIEMPRIDNLLAVDRPGGLRVSPTHKQVSVNKRSRYCRLSDLLKVVPDNESIVFKLQDRLGVVA